MYTYVIVAHIYWWIPHFCNFSNSFSKSIQSQNSRFAFRLLRRVFMPGCDYQWYVSKL